VRLRRRLRAPDDLPLRDVVTHTFTPEQADAIARRDGDLMLSANAGSGKTSVLVERFVASVIEDGLRPDQVLAITFTDKAAGELRARVRARLLELGEREGARQAEGAWITTFHGFCQRILRAHAVAAGLDPAFSVLEPAEARAAVREAFDAALAAFLADPRAAALDLAAAYTVDRLQRVVVTAHDALRSRGQTRPSLPEPRPADLRAAGAELERAQAAFAAELATAPNGGASVDAAREALQECGARLRVGDEVDIGAVKVGRTAAALKTPAADAYREACDRYARALADRRAVPALALVDELLGRYADAYAQAKRARTAVDFDDLELLCRDLLVAEPGIAAGYRDRFARIMVDEFQDTNPLQLELLELIARDNACTVGDELQAIYAFRHADVEVFRARRAALAAQGRAASLATNFRSRPEILGVLNRAFAPLHDHWVDLRPGRTDPPAAEPVVELLVTDADAWNGDAPAALGVGLPAASAVKQAEARLVAQRVGALVHEEGVAPRDVVVLLRASAEMGLYERALELAGLPTLAGGGRGWWARQQVRDLCHLLAALANPRDEEALLGLLASPMVGLTSDALALLALTARGAGRTIWEAVDDPALRLAPDDAERLAAFRTWFAAERERAPRLGLDEIMARGLRRTRYDLHVLALPRGARRLANINKLLRLAASYESRRGRDVRGFIDLANAELEADAREADAPVDLGGLDAVRLMTIHAAKGLEFPVVVVADLGRKGNLSPPDLHVDGDRVGLRLVDLEAKKATALDFDAIEAERRDADEAEERRVMHVAMTRAEERLILSGAARLGEHWPQPCPGAAPISWIGPALVPGIAALDVAEPEREHVVGELAALAAAAPGEAAASGRAGDAAPPGGPPRVRTVLNSPASGVLRLEAPAPVAPGEQLALALNGGAPAAAPPPATPLAEPESAPAPPAALSYSSLSRYAACPYRFHLERGLGLPEQPPPAHLREAPAETTPAPTLDLLLRGTLVHELLEGLDLRGGATIPDADAVRAIAAVHETELTDEDVADLQSMVEAFATSSLRARLAGARSIHREHAFAFVLTGGPLLNGFVDVIAREDDGSALIVDYKSDQVGDADLEALVEASYATQRRIYALAALRSGAPAVEVAHVFLERPGEPAVARYEQADADALDAELQARAAPLLAGEYPVAEVPHRGLCATCPGRDGMCSYPPELTDRELA
jgi:ATP-dependent helicase/nuclease subunit A